MSDGTPPTERTDAGFGGRRPGDDLAARSATALAALTAPDHAPGFWDDLDRTFADEPQLRLAPRSAIRPITQPPPVIDDRTVVESGGPPPGAPPKRRRWRRRPLLWVIVVGVVGLGLAGAMRGTAGTGTDGDVSAADDVSPPGTAATTAPTEPEEAEQPEQAEEAEDSRAGVDPRAALAPSGIGDLQVLAPLRRLRNAGVGITVDERTFRASGNTCFDATVDGSPDLRLRFRSPDPGVPMADHAEGRLVAVDIDADRLAEGPTTRAVAGTDVQLGAPEEQVLMLYARNLREVPHPSVPGGHVYIAPVGDGTGVAFGTDGRVVTSIAVGLEEVIRFVDGCG